MTISPIMPWPVLLILGILLAGFTVWRFAAAKGERKRSDRTSWVRRFLLVAVLIAMALRPGIPGQSAQTTMSNTNVFFVVDTTASSVAEDYGPEKKPRLDGMKADINRIVKKLPGARFSIITFDHDPIMRLPLTKDASTVAAGVDVLEPEVTADSKGSSISIAHDFLADQLKRAKNRYAMSVNAVFYFGDGEQTISQKPESFEKSKDLLSGGGVFGYGTAQGGPMLKTNAYTNEKNYIQYHGEKALSKIDEKNLRAIAGQLGVKYVHRTGDASLPSFVGEIGKSRVEADDDNSYGRFEFYWLLAIVLIGLVLWELVVLLGAARQLSRASTRKGER